MRTIEYSGQVLAKIISIGECTRPIQFFSEADDALQVGVSICSKGNYIQNHIHNIFPRNSMILNEVLYVVKGAMKANLYSADRKFVESALVKEGEFIILLNGGHGFEPLTDETVIFEAKNGPFVSVEHDKTKF